MLPYHTQLELLEYSYLLLSLETQTSVSTLKTDLEKRSHWTLPNKYID